MSHDTVSLMINNTEISHWSSYVIEADMYTADHAFRLEFSNPDTPITPGARCDLYINGVRELAGIADRVTSSVDKRGRRLTLEGRDLMGLLVDSCCTSFVQVQNMTCQALCQMLLQNVPFIGAKSVVYQSDVRGNLKKRRSKSGAAGAVIFIKIDAAQVYTHIEPGQTIFEVLKTFASSRGLMFFGYPDGTFVFGAPLLGGAPSFFIRMNKENNPALNNATSGFRLDDLSKRYSEIIVTGQQQGQDTVAPAAINTVFTMTDSTFPFTKPFVITDNNDARSPQLHAQMLINKQRAEGFRLEYTVPYHSQGGQNWAINTICHVSDDVHGIEGDYLIYRRTFEMTKESGPSTRLRLGYPGLAV